MITRSSWSMFALACLLSFPSTPVLAQNVLVVFHSPGGHTALMAGAVAAGAEDVSGTVVRAKTIEEASADDLLWADAIIVGSPVHAANLAAPVANFLSGFPFDGQMKDRIGAAFVTAGGMSAGEEAAQLSILRAMLVYNMIVIGGPTWSEAFGASGFTQEEPFMDSREDVWLDPIFLAKGAALGKRVAEVTRRFDRDGPR